MLPDGRIIQHFEPNMFFSLLRRERQYFFRYPGKEKQISKSGVYSLKHPPQTDDRA